MVLFDSHAHYDDARFDENRASVLDGIFAQTDVSYIVNVGTNPQTSRASVELAHTYSGIYAAVGIHPSDACRIADEDAAFRELQALLADPKAVAIGEIGLDYHYDDTPRDVQYRYFERQMEWARKTGYPVIIHDREAHGDCMDMIRRFPEVTGILHSFSGSVEMVTELVRRGWYISFSGVITFKNAAKILDCVRAVPDDRLLLETDCPYLAPVPVRGSTNHSGNLIYTARAAADVRGTDIETICRMTAQNAACVYRLGDLEL